MNERILNAFLKAIAHDRSLGITRTLAEYQALWAGHEDDIARKFREIFGNEEDGAAPPSANAGRIGSYELVRLLGRGGQGEVHLARDLRLGRQVALKILDAGVVLSPAAQVRFKREAELAARLDHPGLGTVFEAGQEGRCSFIATAFHGGGSLAHAIEAARADRNAAPFVPRDGAALRRLARAFADLAGALAVAHDAGVLHRDVKPSNIMLREDGGLVLIDFGLARAIVDDATMDVTQSGELFGTSAYLAPELISGRGRPDRRTDLYAFGATLFETLTGRPPFDGPTREAILDRVLREDPARPSTRNPVIPRDLDAIVETLLDKDPDRRYADAAAVAQDLLAVAEGRPVSVVRLTAAGRARRWLRRRPLVAGLILLVALGLATASVFLGLWIADRPAVAETLRRERAAACERLLEDASFQLHHGSLPIASRLVNEAIAADPDSIDARALGAIIAVASTKTVDDALLAPLRANGREDLVAPIRALAAFEAGSLDDADRKLAEAPPPTSAVAHFTQGMVRLRIAHHGRPAESRATSAADARPDESALHELDLAVATATVARRLYHMERLHAAFHLGDRKRCLDVVEAATPICGSSPTGSAWIVECLAEAGESERALKLAQSILAEHAEALRERPHLHARVFDDCLVLLARLGDSRAVIEQADRFTALFPGQPQGMIQKARAKARLGELEEAAAVLAEIERRGLLSGADAGTRMTFLSFAADLARAAGQPTEAIRRLKEAVTVSPSDPGARVALARMLFETNDPGALAAARTAVETSPADAWSWARLGVLADDGAEAERALSRACELPGTPSFAGAELARRLEARGRFDEAITLCERSLRAGFEPARGQLAEIYVALGETDALERLAKEGLSTNPADPYPTLAAAFAARERGRFAEAASLAERSLELAQSAGRPPPDAAHALAEDSAALAAALEDEDAAADAVAKARLAHAIALSDKRARTEEAWRAAMEALGRAADETRSNQLESAALDILRSRPQDPDASMRTALVFIERRLRTWTKVAVAEPAAADSLRAMRRLLRHAAFASATTTAALDALSPDQNLAWRKLIDGLKLAVENLAAQVETRPVVR